MFTQNRMMDLEVIKFIKDQPVQPVVFDYEPGVQGEVFRSDRSKQVEMGIHEVMISSYAV